MDYDLASLVTKPRDRDMASYRASFWDPSFFLGNFYAVMPFDFYRLRAYKIRLPLVNYQQGVSPLHLNF